MSSSTEAFRKLEMWKNAKTRLKLTVVTKGEKPEISRGVIVATDAEAALVIFIPDGKRYAPRLDLAKAEFTVAERVVEVRRGDGETAVFEELRNDCIRHTPSV